MQPLVPYLSGRETHSKGNRLVDVQPCIRTADIEEVGDANHTTFFEMLGNWSFGDYFKREQLTWKWEFLTGLLGLSKEKLYVTVFEGNDEVPRDEESAAAWKDLGVSEDHIYFCGVKSNWWSRSGDPKEMPMGEIGGPSSEVFYYFGNGPHSGPESDERNFLEIGNSVFIQYVKAEDGTLVLLPQNNVDFGGGLERIAAALNNDPDVYRTDIFTPIIKAIEHNTHATYEVHASDIRVIADHIRAAVFLIRDGVMPSNKEHGYILRRLLRRAAVRTYMLGDGVNGLGILPRIVEPVTDLYQGIYFHEMDTAHIVDVVRNEMNSFSATIERGMREIERYTAIDGKGAFDLFQSYGFPIELTVEVAKDKGTPIDLQEFETEKEKHRLLSQSSSSGKFKGGLADTSDQVVRYHTATHLLHQALKDVYGDIIRQEGSNITQDRLRFDVRLDRKPTEEEMRDIEKTVNAQIDAALPVYKKDMPRQEAEALGAASFFREKYGDIVSVYFIGGSDDDPSTAYSKEFCGGPHVQNTSEIGRLKITRTKKIGSDIIRFYLETA
jgi:alanyl-tRNA synthetase